jgi:hypothetical protein
MPEGESIANPENNHAREPEPLSKKELAPHRLKANRANAALSTGPRTAAGKAVSRLNSLKHGIFAQEAVNAIIEGPEARAMFEQMLDGLAEEFEPATRFECIVVERIAACLWRLKRVLRLENRAAWRAQATQLSVEEAEMSDYGGITSGLAQVVAAEERVFTKAGLTGITLPNDHASRRILRYETAMNRELHRLLALLQRTQRSRRALEFAHQAAARPTRG